MKQDIRLDLTKSRGAPTGAIVALVGSCLLLGASTSSARNEFKNGFEDELGRIVAHQVAAIGQAVLAPPLVVREEVRVERVRPRWAPRPRAWRPHRHVHPPRRHGPWRWKRPHRHHRGCGARGISTRVTVIETRERPRHRHRRSWVERSRWRARYDY